MLTIYGVDWFWYAVWGSLAVAALLLAWLGERPGVGAWKHSLPLVEVQRLRRVGRRRVIGR